MLLGITVLFSDLMRSLTARDTSTAFCPGFLVTLMVTAGLTLPACIAATLFVPSGDASFELVTIALPGVNQT